MVQSAQQGDRRALDEILRREQERIYRYGMRMCRHEADAEEIVQETMLAMARNLDSYEGRASLSSWLFTIARSFCIKKRRKSKFAPKHEENLREEQHVSAEVETPEDALGKTELREQLQKAVDSLDDEYRDVFVLRDFEGLSTSEVADVLGISSAAVKSRLHRARGQMRKLMAPHMDVEKAPIPKSDCPDVIALLSKHLEGELSPSACAEMERHVEQCASCRSACACLKDTLQLCQVGTQNTMPDEVKENVQQALRTYLSTGTCELR